MKTVVYRLKAVLMRDTQHYGHGRHYAYIWVPNYSSKNENGNWWKFGDTTVSEVRLKHIFI